jgi:hypothetical protein
MQSVASVGYWAGALVVGGFTAIVFWRLFTRKISLTGLLEGDSRGATGYTTGFSPGRAQLLTFTLLFAVYYLAQLIGNPKAFPQVPDSALAVLGGSQATYLGGKAYALLLKNRSAH